jgi:hypothetical protein
MEVSSLYRIAQELQGIEMRIESAEEGAGHMVVLVGKNASYRSRLLTEQGAVSVKRFLMRLRDREGTADLKGESDQIVERHAERHPNLSRKTVRETINELGEDWDESVLDEELTRRSYTRMLEKHLRAGAWGVLITTQRDQNVCSVCQELDEVAYGIRRALREKPLPCRECTNRTCRCSYLPVFQKGDLYEEIPRRTL